MLPSSHTRNARWALVGYGSGGRVFHAPLIAAASGVHFVAVVTGNPDRQAQVAADHPGVATVGDLAALPGLGVEAVTITTPPATHTDLAHQALDLGLDVVVDKPFALTAVAARALIDHARQAGRMLTAYQNRRWDSDFLTVRKLMADGALGTVHRFTSRIDRFRPVKAGWASSPEKGGGTLLDLGPHLIDQALHLFGPVDRLHAQVRAVRPGSEADDEIELHLEHASGVFSTVAAGMATAAEGPRFQVNGLLGGFLVNGFDVQEAQLKAGLNPAGLGDGWGLEEPAAYGTSDNGSRLGPGAERARPLGHVLPGSGRCDPGTGPAPVDPGDAVATAEIIDAARLSAAEHRVVELSARPARQPRVGLPAMSAAQTPTYTGHVDPQGAPATRRLADITITKLSVGPMDNNAYLLVCLETGDAVLIDAANDSDRIADLLGDGPDRPRLRSIVTTHSHGDHWQALGAVAGQTGANLYAGVADAADLPVPTDVPLGQGDIVPLGNCRLESISLRGHTPGSVALLYQDPSGTAHLFTGDSLFPGGPGRTTSPRAFTSLMDDLTDRVFDRLPDDTWVYRGHGDDTTLGNERPHLAQWRERGW